MFVLIVQSIGNWTMWSAHCTLSAVVGASGSVAVQCRPMQCSVDHVIIGAYRASPYSVLPKPSLTALQVVLAVSQVAIWTMSSSIEVDGQWRHSCLKRCILVCRKLLLLLSCSRCVVVFSHSPLPPPPPPPLETTNDNHSFSGVCVFEAAAPANTIMLLLHVM